MALSPSRTGWRCCWSSPGGKRPASRGKTYQETLNIHLGEVLCAGIDDGDHRRKTPTNSVTGAVSRQKPSLDTQQLSIWPSWHS